MKRILLVLVVFALLAIAAQCGATPTPEVVEKVVTVEVEKEVEVETIVTVEVEKEVEVETIVTVEVEKEVEAAGPFTIGYAAPSLAGGQIDIQEGLVRQAEAKGWQTVTSNANGDPQRQNDDIDYFISLGVDAIVTVPQDSAGICAAAEKAQEAGIPFFTIDRSPIGCQIDMTVLSDNRLAGQQSGQAMVDLLTEKYGAPQGKVLEITGDLGQNVGMLRRDGFHDILDEYPDIEVITKPGDWDAALGVQIVEDVLNANPDLDGIYMHSDAVYVEGTIAVLGRFDMLEQRGEEGHIFLTAVDGSPSGIRAIRDGWHDESSNQPVPDFGRQAVEWIEKAVVNGEPIEEGEVVQEGALWSPAQIIINEDGTPELFLSTTPVTEENTEDPGLWANQTLG
jgi:ABC-type sugar transport system substrate-binding protein